MVYHNTAYKKLVCEFDYPINLFTPLNGIVSVSKANILKIQQPPQTLRELAQTKMRDAIISGVFEPGQRLVERTLCEQIGVSRSVIREVIRTLEAEGLVDVLPNQGPIVAVLHWDQAQQIYDIRELLEASAAADCARLATDEDLVALKSALEQLLAQRAKGDPSAVLADTNSFYDVLFKAAGHHLAWDVVQRLNGRISRLRVLTLSTSDRLQKAPAHLQAIYRAIAEHDADKSALACRTHVREAKAVAERVLGKDESSQQ